MSQRKFFFNRSVFFAISLLLMAEAVGAVEKRISGDMKKDVDSVEVRSSFPEVNPAKKMSTSSFPVQMHVVGHTIRVQSDYNQILPIYNQNGVFYMAMRLSKGTNWLNGLPRGRYFINNRPININ